jgi:hypothetical protein
MKTELEPCALPYVPARHRDRLPRTAVKDFLDAYSDVLESRRALDEARDTGFDYGEAFRKQIHARASFADQALEFARLLRMVGR